MKIRVPALVAPLTIISLSVSTVLAATPAGTAATSSAKANDELYVITANRTLKKLDETLSSVTVIEREDIERSQARTLDELLVAVEGVAIARQGGIGQPTSVYVRGGESDHVLWMIDGVRIGSVTTGIPALQDLPLDTVERIEIVRGPRSSLYGADAKIGRAHV